MEIDMLVLKTENQLLRKQLEIRLWKDRNEVPAPQGEELLLYMVGGTMIQGNSHVIGYTHWMRKPPSPSKQKGNIK